jgi:hypothetical protein
MAINVFTVLPTSLFTKQSSFGEIHWGDKNGKNTNNRSLIQSHTGAIDSKD